jgi:hypothetical protein
LFKVINDKQIEYRDKFMPLLQQQPNETPENFAARQKRVYDSFVTAMSIHTTNGAWLHGNNESFLDETNLPDQIWSVLFNTGTVPQAVLGILPACRITVFLDFTAPPLFDFSRLPTLPTPNESNYEIFSDNQSWFVAAKAMLSDFFAERRTNVNWLHRAAVYDLLLFFLGLPLAIWIVYRLSEFLQNWPKVPLIISSAIFIYAFFLALNIFRLLFSYSRWVFPKVELETQRLSSPLRHRAAWLAIIVPIAAAFIYDLGKSLLTH